LQRYHDHFVPQWLHVATLCTFAPLQSSTIVMSIQSEELAVAIPHSLRLLARSIGMELDKAGIPMNLSQFGMLDFLLTNSEAVQTDLANHLHKDKSVILRQLDQLEQNGWVERQMDPDGPASQEPGGDQGRAGDPPERSPYARQGLCTSRWKALHPSKWPLCWKCWRIWPATPCLTYNE
jgi:hypothetical protein